jgi:N-acetylglucosaminyldiphosphoundecaprenol N-acetyl-beta-D-mannosaminyltransferase
MNTSLSILGVPFHSVTLKETIQILEKSCDEKRKLFCVTPNPEICLLAFKDSKYRSILQSADLSIPDGFGILWAARYLNGSRNLFRWLGTLLTPHQTFKNTPLPERVTGTDVMKEFCRKQKHRRVFLLGASDHVNKLLAQKLLLQGVKVVGNFSGDSSPALEFSLRKMINSSGAEVLFVAFGAPKQEAWITRNLPHLPSVKVAMGVGGAFDFLSGTKKRAPSWMRTFGIEWLYRLLIEPSRFKRICKATILFPWTVYRFSK